MRLNILVVEFAIEVVVSSTSHALTLEVVVNALAWTARHLFLEIDHFCQFCVREVNRGLCIIRAKHRFHHVGIEDGEDFQKDWFVIRVADRFGLVRRWKRTSEKCDGLDHWPAFAVVQCLLPPPSAAGIVLRIYSQ